MLERGKEKKNCINNINKEHKTMKYSKDIKNSVKKLWENILLLLFMLL